MFRSTLCSIFSFATAVKIFTEICVISFSLFACSSIMPNTFCGDYIFLSLPQLQSSKDSVMPSQTLFLCLTRSDQSALLRLNTWLKKQKRNECPINSSSSVSEQLFKQVIISSVLHRKNVAIESIFLFMHSLILWYSYHKLSHAIILYGTKFKHFILLKKLLKGKD